MKQKQCSSYVGYSVTEGGEVYTHRRRLGLGQGKGSRMEIDPTYAKRLNHYNGHGGYLYVSISVRGKQRPVPIHRLLLDAFVGPCPDGMECRHLDGNPMNNNLSNLCYGTVRQNAKDRATHGRNRAGEAHPRSKLRATQVIAMRKQYLAGTPIATIARSFSVAESTAVDIVKGRKWKHLL